MTTKTSNWPPPSPGAAHVGRSKRFTYVIYVDGLAYPILTLDSALSAVGRELHERGFCRRIFEDIGSEAL